MRKITAKETDKIASIVAKKIVKHLEDNVDLLNLTPIQLARMMTLHIVMAVGKTYREAGFEMTKLEKKTKRKKP